MNGKTYKVTSFLPMDWQLWEQNESDPFYFNDAGNNPTAAGECLSLRHSGIANWYRIKGNPPAKAPGGAVVGTVSGVAQFVKWPAAYRLITSPGPNDLLSVGWR